MEAKPMYFQKWRGSAHFSLLSSPVSKGKAEVVNLDDLVDSIGATVFDGSSLKRKGTPGIFLPLTLI